MLKYLKNLKKLYLLNTKHEKTTFYKIKLKIIIN
jgi:hypothetical protein